MSRCVAVFVALNLAVGAGSWAALATTTATALPAIWAIHLLIGFATLMVARQVSRTLTMVRLLSGLGLWFLASTVAWLLLFFATSLAVGTHVPMVLGLVLSPSLAWCSAAFASALRFRPFGAPDRRS